MTPRRSAPPLWFLLCVAVVVGVLLKGLWGNAVPGSDGGGHTQQVSQAFLGFLITLASLIWKGLEVAGKVTLEVLKWVVANLSLVVGKLVNGLKGLGHDLLIGLKRVWSFTRRIYDDVLKPAWGKFWHWFDKFRRWLDDTFGPVLRWLRRLRDNLLLFWKTFVRPWLDLIDVTRRALRILSGLGIDWARKLDAQLGALEEKIEKPFRLVLAKVNEVINLVNRIVTLDGLLQRAALVRSIVRDYQYVWNVVRSAYSRPLDAADKTAITDKHKVRPVEAINTEALRYIQTGDGPKAALFEEMYLQVRNRVRARP